MKARGYTREGIKFVQCVRCGKRGVYRPSSGAPERCKYCDAEARKALDKET